MLAIHGIWAHGACWLWAENSGIPPGPGRHPRQQRQPGRPTAKPHPFAGDAGSLADTLARIAEPAADLVRKAAENDLTLWLPASGDVPLASPELVQPAEAGRPKLAPWQVQALTFEPAAALGVLGALGSLGAQGEAVPPAEVAVGASVHYLAAVARMATDLVSRGRVLPGLTSQDGRYAARWLPVLTGLDAERGRDLAGAMPPVCRAAAGGSSVAGGSSAAGASSAGILTEALEALTDAAARAVLGSGAGKQATLLPPRRDRAPASVPVAERWVAALTAVDPQLTIGAPEEETEAAGLAEALREWRAAAQVPAGPVRTCFRLVEPATAAEPDPATEPGVESERQDEAWRIEFALQSTTDPSLVIPAADVWAGPAPVGVGHAEEELLAGLGRAARLFPELDAELRTPRPAVLAMDAGGAYRFVKETAPLLSGSGFGVLLPAWARKARLGLKLTTRSKNAASQAVRSPDFGLEDLLEFRYDIAVGDQALDPAELAELARRKVPLVRLRGQWVELDQRQLQAALRFMERNRAGDMRAGDALLTGLRGAPDGEGQEGPGGLPLVEVDADGWLADLLSGQADRRLQPAGTPESFSGELRPYQRRGLAWLSFLNNLGLGGILADDMGLGKTVQLLALLAAERAGTGATSNGVTGGAAVKAKSTLLVCPMSLVGNWQREAERFTPQLSLHVHHGADRLTGEALADALKAADLVITTYAVAARDRDTLSAIGWRRVVCDEAQNIKNNATRQAQAVRGLRAASKIALTGTPVENHLSELWSIMEFVNPGLLGSAERFRSSYAIPIERHGDEEATAALKRITGPFILRRLKTDRSIISDLPGKLEMKVWCNLTAEQASLYQATALDMLARIERAQEDIERRGLVLATMARLKQVCNHPAHLLGDGSRLAGRSGKLARLEEICDEVLADGDKALCFTQYAEFGAMLQPYLAARLGCRVLYLHGGTSKRQRDALVAQFQDSGEPAVFLLSLKAGGTGLNLTAANHVIHVDRWWNPAVEDQATDRAFRIGQRKDVQVRKFICVGTLEERIDRMIDEKKALAERVVGTGEGWLTELSVAELRDVIALSPEAVSE
jgi:SNF2 family DNA or RNA helicase